MGNILCRKSRWIIKKYPKLFFYLPSLLSPCVWSFQMHQSEVFVLLPTTWPRFRTNFELCIWVDREIDSDEVGSRPRPHEVESFRFQFNTRIKIFATSMSITFLLSFCCETRRQIKLKMIFFIVMEMTTRLGGSSDGRIGNKVRQDGAAESFFK